MSMSDDGGLNRERKRPIRSRRRSSDKGVGMAAKWQESRFDPAC
jgi:hypothetical protein